jgi:hypothetical protein
MFSIVHRDIFKFGHSFNKFSRSYYRNLRGFAREKELKMK